MKTAWTPAPDSAAGRLVTSRGGAAHRAADDIGPVRDDFDASLHAAVQAGHRLGEQSAWEWQGKLEAEAKNFSEGFGCWNESEAVIERSGGAIPVDQQDRMRRCPVCRARGCGGCAQRVTRRRPRLRQRSTTRIGR